jgi:hypothetical protein
MPTLREAREVWLLASSPLATLHLGDFALTSSVLLQKGSDKGGVLLSPEPMQKNPGGDRDVERVGLRSHRDRDSLIAEVDPLGIQAIGFIAEE